MGSNQTSESIARYYVNQFVTIYSPDIQGNVLEIGRSVYSDQFKSQAQSYQCLDIEAYDDVDIVADIQDMKHVQDNSFDSILCTQVLEHVKNPFLAVAELHRVLKPGGKLFLTVPFLNNIHMEPHDYWRFTEFSIAHLLSEFAKVEIFKYGNTANYILATLGISATELDEDILLQDVDDDQFYIIVGAIARKCDL
jgi:ubiquinone/menaquinone biosynthesis C-methylase UbiE